MLKSDGLLGQCIKYLLFMETQFDKMGKVYSLQMFGLNLILSSILKERSGSSTPIEIQHAFYAKLSEKCQLQQLLHKNLSASQRNSQHSTVTPLLLLIDKFNLCHASLLKPDFDDTPMA